MTLITGESGLDNEEPGEEDAEASNEDDGATPSARGTSQPKRRFVPPSSVGLSFFVSGDGIRLQLIPSGVRYEPVDELTKAGRADRWRRIQLGAPDSDTFDVEIPAHGRAQTWRRPVFLTDDYPSRGEFFMRWRPLHDGWLVTLSLSNTQIAPEIADKNKEAAEHSRLALFEVELECISRRRRGRPLPRRAIQPAERRGAGARASVPASSDLCHLAQDQVQRLYGREAAVFPPPGMDGDDSYFARTVPTSEKPGRLYVGYLAPTRNRQRCMAPLAAALLTAPEVLFSTASADREALLDAWWTVLVYHGSLRTCLKSISRHRFAVSRTSRRSAP